MSLRLLKSTAGLRCYSYAAGGKVPEKTKLIINGKFEDSQTKSWVDVHSESWVRFLKQFFFPEHCWVEAGW
jgi:hypothetical protein